MGAEPLTGNVAAGIDRRYNRQTELEAGSQLRLIWRGDVDPVSCRWQTCRRFELRRAVVSAEAISEIHTIRQVEGFEEQSDLRILTMEVEILGQTQIHQEKAAGYRVAVQVVPATLGIDSHIRRTS